MNLDTAGPAGGDLCSMELLLRSNFTGQYLDVCSVSVVQSHRDAVCWFLHQGEWNLPESFSTEVFHLVPEHTNIRPQTCSPHWQSTSARPPGGAAEPRCSSSPPLRLLQGEVQHLSLGLLPPLDHLQDADSPAELSPQPQHLLVRRLVVLTVLKYRLLLL